MKDPLTVKFFQKEVRPHVSNKTEYKNLESHVKACEALEKSWKSKPLNPQSVKLLNNALNNVEKTLGAIKKPSNGLKAAQMKVFKAIGDFKDAHNTKFVDKITTKTIGAIPGGLKTLEAIDIKAFNTANTMFRKATQTLKQDDSQQLLKIHAAFRSEINVSIGRFKEYDTHKRDVETAIAGLKDAAKRGDNDLRKTLLAQYKQAVKALYTITAACREEVVAMQNQSIIAFRGDLKMS